MLDTNVPKGESLSAFTVAVHACCCAAVLGRPRVKSSLQPPVVHDHEVAEKVCHKPCGQHICAVFA